MTFYVTHPYRWMNRSMMRPWLVSNENAAREALAPVPVDVKETHEAYSLSALLPGVQAEDLDIEILKDRVTLRGEFKHAEEDEDAYLLRERPAGKFERTLRFADPLNADGSTASLKDGVLTLTLPKAEEARPKNIKVQGE
jgi:HSP20 family protein